MIYCKQDIVQNVIGRSTHSVREKEIYSIRRSVALCVGVAVLLHYVSFTNPYLQSICHLLRPFIYMGLYLVWAISFQRELSKEPVVV